MLLPVCMWKYGSISYIGMTRKKNASQWKRYRTDNAKIHMQNSTTNTRTKYSLVVMHKTLCSVQLTFVRRENETVQNCPIVLQNSSSYYSFYFAVTHKLHKLQSQTRTHIALPILVPLRIKKDTRHVGLEFPRTATLSYSTHHRNSANDSK